MVPVKPILTAGSICLMGTCSLCRRITCWDIRNGRNICTEWNYSVHGHMGVAYMQKISLVDGELTFEDLLEESLSDDPDDSYTLPGEVILSAFFFTMQLRGHTADRYL